MTTTSATNAARCYSITCRCLCRPFSHRNVVHGLAAHRLPCAQNSVRHNLSLRACFVRVPRVSTEGKKLSAWWTLDTTCLPVAAKAAVRLFLAAGASACCPTDHTPAVAASAAGIFYSCNSSARANPPTPLAGGDSSDAGSPNPQDADSPLSSCGSDEELSTGSGAGGGSNPHLASGGPIQALGNPAGTVTTAQQAGDRDSGVGAVIFSPAATCASPGYFHVPHADMPSTSCWLQTTPPGSMYRPPHPNLQPPVQPHLAQQQHQCRAPEFQRGQLQQPTAPGHLRASVTDVFRPTGGRVITDSRTPTAASLLMCPGTMDLLAAAASEASVTNPALAGTCIGIGSTAQR